MRFPNDEMLGKVNKSVTMTDEVVPRLCQSMGPGLEGAGKVPYKLTSLTQPTETNELALSALCAPLL